MKKMNITYYDNNGLLSLRVRFMELHAVFNSLFLKHYGADGTVKITNLPVPSAN